MKTSICGICFIENKTLLNSPCKERPELLKGQPIGMYHCPDCGMMVLAGLPHPKVCNKCYKEIENGIDY